MHIVTILQTLGSQQKDITAVASLMLKLRSHLTDNQGAVKLNSSGLTTIEDQHKTLFERLGGQPAIDALVDGMYGRIFQDPQLDHYFVDTDKEKLKAR